MIAGELAWISRLLFAASWRGIAKRASAYGCLIRCLLLPAAALSGAAGAAAFAAGARTAVAVCAAAGGLETRLGKPCRTQDCSRALAASAEVVSSASAWSGFTLRSRLRESCAPIAAPCCLGGQDPVMGGRLLPLPMPVPPPAPGAAAPATAAPPDDPAVDVASRAA